MYKLIVFIAFSILLSCGSKDYISARVYNIDNSTWEVQDTIMQRVFIQDTSKLYQVSIFISSIDSGTNKVQVLSSICYNGICSIADTIEVNLGKELPKTLISKERKNKFLVMDNVSFPSVGEYVFNFSPLESTEITAFGVYIY